MAFDGLVEPDFGDESGVAAVPKNTKARDEPELSAIDACSLCQGLCYSEEGE